MPINVDNPEADALTRKFAHIVGISTTEAIVIAMREAIEHRRNLETPLQTAARRGEEHGVKLRPTAKKPPPRKVFEEM